MPVQNFLSISFLRVFASFQFVVNVYFNLKIRTLQD